MLLRGSSPYTSAYTMMSRQVCCETAARQYTNGGGVLDPAVYNQWAFVLMYLGTGHLGVTCISDGPVLSSVTTVRTSALMAECALQCHKHCSGLLGHYYRWCMGVEKRSPADVGKSVKWRLYSGWIGAGPACVGDGRGWQV